MRHHAYTLLAFLAMLLAMPFSAFSQTVVTFVAGTDKGSNKTYGNQKSIPDTISKDGITISGTHCALARDDHYKFYGAHEIHIVSTIGNITKIVFTCTEKVGKDYGADNLTPTSSNGDYKPEAYTGTWKGEDTSITLKNKASKQVRMTKIAVTIEASLNDGTLEHPYSVAEVLNGTVASGTEGVWVKGYIVGCGASVSDANIGATATYDNLFLADNAAETSAKSVMAVQLPTGDIQESLCLTDHAEHLGTEVWVHGSIGDFLNTVGLTAIDHFSFDGTFTIYESLNLPLVAATYEKTTLRRTLSSEYWNTFCCPFGISASQVSDTFGAGTVIARYTGDSDNTMNFELSDYIETGVAYLLKPAKTVANPVFSNVSIVADTQPASSAGTAYLFNGVFSPTPLDTATDLFIAKSGNVSRIAEGKNTINGLRAYIRCTDATSPKPKMNFAIDVTNIDGTALTPSVTSAKVFNLHGQCVGTSTQRLPKGIYVSNGKKFVVR